MTARHLVESSRSISEATQNPHLNTRRNTAKIVVGLTVVFMISYVPYHVSCTYTICTADVSILSTITDILLYSNYELQHTYLISTCLLLINPCLNPVALFCTSSPSTQHLKRYLTCCYKTNSPPADLQLARRNWFGSQNLHTVNEFSLGVCSWNYTVRFWLCWAVTVCEYCIRGKSLRLYTDGHPGSLRCYSVPQNNISLVSSSQIHSYQQFTIFSQKAMAEQVGRTGERSGTYRVVVGRAEGNMLLGRSRSRW